MWVELKGLLVDKSLSNLGIDTTEQEIEVKFAFNTECIEAFRQVIDDNGNNVPDESIIYLKGNETFVVKHTYEELRKLLTQ